MYVGLSSTHMEQSVISDGLADLSELTFKKALTINELMNNLLHQAEKISVIGRLLKNNEK